MDQKRRETTMEERKIILRLHNQCKSLREIAELVGKPRSTIQGIVDRFCKNKSLKNLPRSGRPPALSQNDERFIVRQIKKNPKMSAPKITGELKMRGNTVSEATIRTALRENGYHGRIPRKKPWISAVNRQKRLEFAKKYEMADQSLFDNIIFSDESKYNLFGSDGKVKVWRTANSELQPKNLAATVKHGGGSVLVWGCFSSHGVGKLVFIDGIMDHKMYINILKENLKKSAEDMGIGQHFYFQQDNDPKHTAYNTKMWLLYNVPKQFSTPPQSPDMNPIENLWSYLESRIRERHISSKVQLKEALLDEWTKIPRSLCKKLVDSMRRRLQAVIKAKGYATKY